MKKYVAELVGTFVLVFGGVGSAVLAGSHIGFTGVAFAFGLSLLAMAYAIGPISGCHINPAVTLGILIAKKIDAKDAVLYMVAQVIGAVIGAGTVLFVAKGLPYSYAAHVSGLGANGYGAHSPGQFSLAACFVAEVVLTGFLVLTVLGSTDIAAPVGFAGPAGGGERLWVALGDPDLVDMLAEPDIGRPFAQLDAARDIDACHAQPQ